MYTTKERYIDEKKWKLCKEEKPEKAVKWTTRADGITVR
jgi:hypothetical protein